MSDGAPETPWTAAHWVAACAVAALVVLSAPVCASLLRGGAPPGPPLTAQAAAASLQQIDAEIVRADGLATQAQRAPRGSAQRHQLARAAVDRLQIAQDQLMDVAERTAHLPSGFPDLESRLGAIRERMRAARRLLAE